MVCVDLGQSGDCRLLSQCLLKPDCIWQDQAVSAMKEDKKSVFPFFNVNKALAFRVGGLDRESWDLRFPEGPLTQTSIHRKSALRFKVYQGENYKIILVTNSVSCQLSVNNSWAPTLHAELGTRRLEEGRHVFGPSGAVKT